MKRAVSMPCDHLTGPDGPTMQAWHPRRYRGFPGRIRL